MTTDQIKQAIFDALDARYDTTFEFEVYVFDTDPDEEKWLTCWVKGGYESETKNNGYLEPPTERITEVWAWPSEFYGPWTDEQKRAANQGCIEWAKDFKRNEL